MKTIPLTLGLTWGACMLTLGLISQFGIGVELISMISPLYKGFQPGLIGSLIGAIWGMADGFIGGMLISVVVS